MKEGLNNNELTHKKCLKNEKAIIKKLKILEPKKYRKKIPNYLDGDITRNSIYYGVFQWF